MTDQDDSLASVSRQIKATPETLFAVLADPARHPGIDGSGMLREPSGRGTISALGDEFTMKMNNPIRGDYQMTNRVVEFELNRRIGWEPVVSGVSRAEQETDIGMPLLHRWMFELTPAGTDTTVVTEIYDCSRSPEWLRERGASRWSSVMAETLQKLDQQCSQP
jgi:hypothetical protein